MKPLTITLGTIGIIAGILSNNIIAAVWALAYTAAVIQIE